MKCFRLGWLSGSLATLLLTWIIFPARANVVGTDAQNFNPTTSGLDFVTVQSSEPLKPGIINLGLFFNYAVNTLPYFETSPQSRTNFNDTVLGMDMNMGMGLMKNWDVGISFPQVLQQDVKDQQGARGEFAQTGSTEIRGNTKYRLLGDDTGGIAAIASMSINRIQNSPYMGRDAGPTFTFEVAGDMQIDSKVAVGVNAGYRYRQPGQRLLSSQVEPLKDQMIGSAAVSYYMASINTKFIGEVFGSLPTQRTNSNSDRALSSLEFLAGAKHDFTTNLAGHAGMGIGAYPGTATPDWRVYTGVNYTFGPIFGHEQPEAPPAQGERYLVRVQPTPAPLQAAVVPTPPPVERFRAQKILFEFDSDRMVGNYEASLNELAEYLRKGFSHLTVEGHTDSIGSIAYNQRLSQKRADAIKRYLSTRYGFDAKKISTIGFGESRPIADNGNYQGRQQNRRVEFEIKR